jgi:hypothetical protein
MLDVRVLYDIIVVVVAKEVVVADAAKGYEGNRSKDETDYNDLPRIMSGGRNGKGISGLSVGRPFELGFALARFFGHGGDLR